ncbi:unnamed protein product [Haemonchus placei]|uniref:t-SNARE coiled-coil homology domain-containing protein n=1 Tax=Haemonchus placei TaxID=6290 RepID=A0A0N4X342_HAEPC|nr:unnamed protein product [Haemonchus placei]
MENLEKRTMRLEDAVKDNAKVSDITETNVTQCAKGDDLKEMFSKCMNELQRKIDSMTSQLKKISTNLYTAEPPISEDRRRRSQHDDRSQNARRSESSRGDREHDNMQRSESTRREHEKFHRNRRSNSSHEEDD